MQQHPFDAPVFTKLAQYRDHLCCDDRVVGANVLSRMRDDTGEVHHGEITGATEERFPSPRERGRVVVFVYDRYLILARAADVHMVVAAREPQRKVGFERFAVDQIEASRRARFYRCRTTPGDSRR